MVVLDLPESEKEFIDDEFEADDVLDCTEEIVLGIEKFAKQCMRTFFAGRELHCGGPINPMLFETENALDIVFNTQIEDVVPPLYAAMEEAGLGHITPLGVENQVCETVRILHECEDLGIPKCFRGGLLLLYVELCHGVRVYV